MNKWFINHIYDSYNYDKYKIVKGIVENYSKNVKLVWVVLYNGPIDTLNEKDKSLLKGRVEI